MRARRLIWVAVVAAGCRTAAPVETRAAPPADTRPPSRLADVLRGDWPETCVKLKQGLGPEAHLVFSPVRPFTGQPLPVWKLGFAGFEVSIPQDRYRVIPHPPAAPSGVAGGGEGGRTTEVVLQGAHGKVVLTQGPPPEPIGDVFHSTTSTTQAQEIRTVELFGKIPTQHDLIVEGFKHAPEELTCEPAQRQRELAMAIELLAKPLATPRQLESVAAHGDVYKLGEWIISGARTGGWDWEIHLATADAAVTVDYQASTQAELEKVAGSVRVDACLGECATEGPSWMKKLAAALGQPANRAGWDEVERALHPVASQ